MNVLLFVFAALALAVTQFLTGGWHSALCLPGYGMLAVAALLSWWKTRRTPVPSGAIEGLAAGALFFGYIAIRALLSPEEYLARTDLFMGLAAMSLYLLVALNLTSSHWRGLFVACLLLLGAANSLIGAAQFTKGQNLAIFSFLSRPDYGSRASGFYGYPNHLALFLEVCIMMGLSVAFWSRWRPWIKLLAGYTSLVCVVGLLFTGSRGGYVGAVAGLLVFGLLSLRLVGEFARTRAITLLVAGVLMFTFLGFGVQHLLARSSVLQARVAQEVTNKDVRLQLWKAAWREFKLHPVVGTGSGTYLYYGRQFSNSLIQSDPVHSHNEYLELLGEYGILGIAAALMFLDSHLRSGWKWISRQIARQPDALSIGGNSLAMTVGAMSAVAACLVHSGMDFTLHMPANMLTMAFVFGLLASPGGAQESSSDQADSNFPAYIRLVLPALGLWMAVRALPTWPAEYFGYKARAVTADGKYMESGEEARALEDLAHRGLRWDPRNPQLHRYAGVAETALAIQSADPATQKEWYQQALGSYEKAAALAPMDVHLVLSLAWAYEAQQRYADAEPLFKRAVELDPTASNPHYAYASHLHNQGKLTEAAVEYRVSLQLGGGQSPKMGLDRIAEEMKSRFREGPAFPNPSTNRERRR